MSNEEQVHEGRTELILDRPAVFRAKSLETWVSEALNDKDKDGECTNLCLVHKVGISDVEVHTSRIVPGVPRTARELATMFWNKASAFAQDFDGPQIFNLLAFYGGRNFAEARQPFRITPPADGLGLGSEPPTAQGQVQQSMRHTETLLSGTFRERAMLLQYNFQTIDRLATMNEKLGQENRDAFLIIRDLMAEKIKLGHEEKMKELTFIRATDERKKFMAAAPTMINSIVGKEIFPQTMADTQLIEGLCESVDADKLVLLQGVLPPAVYALLTTRFADYQKKKNAEAEETNRLLGASSNKAAAE